MYGFASVSDPLWVIITVVEAETMALAQQLSRSHLSELNASRNVSLPVDKNVK